jgi:hypothetical protein
VGQRAPAGNPIDQLARRPPAGRGAPASSPWHAGPLTTAPRTRGGG